MVDTGRGDEETEEEYEDISDDVNAGDSNFESPSLRNNGLGITGLVLGLKCRSRADIGDRPKPMEQLDCSGSDEAHTFFKSPDQEEDFLENDFSGARRSAPRRISPLLSSSMSATTTRVYSSVMLM